jgi:glycerophosphoryl diester phosphodiesterase
LRALTEGLPILFVITLWFSVVLIQGCDSVADSYLVCAERDFQNIAHRGASAYAPENTLPAYHAALEMGTSEVELDVQLSEDNVVMLYHDGTLEQKTGEPGSVRNYSAAQLQQMEIGTWFDRTHPGLVRKFQGTRLNTLEELFDEFGSELYYHVELKSSEAALPQLTLAAIDQAGLRSRVRITSFAIEQLRRSLALAPEIPHTLLIEGAASLRSATDNIKGETVLELQKHQVEIAAASGFDQVGFVSEDLSREIVQYAESRGIRVRAWRIEDDADMTYAIDMGACGMTTNWPDRLIQEMNARELGSDPPR